MDCVFVEFTSASAIERRSNQEIAYPVWMIVETVKLLKWGNGIGGIDEAMVLVEWH
jgi:hypothetical protein